MDENLQPLQPNFWKRLNSIQRLSLASVAVLAILLPVGLLLALNPTRLFSRADNPATPITPPTPANGSVMLSLSPGETSVSENEDFTLDVIMDTKKNTVSAAEVYVRYNPSALEVKSVTSDGILAAQIVAPQVNAAAGEISFINGADPVAGPVEGVGKIASIKFKSKGVLGSTKVTFGDGTQIAANDSSSNELGSTTQATVNVVQAVKTGTLRMSLKMQGVSKKSADRVVKVSLVNGRIGSTTQDVTFGADNNGIYSVNLAGVAETVYTVYVKDSTHLRRQIGTVTVLAGQLAAIDGTSKALLGGDFDDNNQIDIFDYGVLVNDFGKTGTPGTVVADINLDGKVDIFDYNFVVTNFNQKGE